MCVPSSEYYLYDPDNLPGCPTKHQDTPSMGYLLHLTDKEDQDFKENYYQICDTDGISGVVPSVGWLNHPKDLDKVVVTVGRTVFSNHQRIIQGIDWTNFQPFHLTNNIQLSGKTIPMTQAAKS